MEPKKPLDILAERRASHDFRWASRTWTGPPYFVRGEPKNPKQLVLAVMESDSVRKVIREVAIEKNMEEESVRKEAEDTLNELAHDLHMYAIRWFGVVLSKLGKRLYNSIQVDVGKLDQIKRAYESYPVLLLPTHRSYVDFLLISYVSFTFELTMPCIAAGMDFKGMVGVGEFLRKSGAFYIRRRFGGDPLYWALISEYVKKAVMQGGHPLEMFVEGTRSRSGKSLKPKLGLLSIIAELVTSGQVPDILILPISMSYDRTLEEGLYAHELLGKPKPKESTNGLMKALKFLGSENYGSVYLNFGEMISMRQMLERTSNPVSSIRPELFLKHVQEIGMRVVLDNQANLAVPIFAGISLVILSEISRNSITIPMESLIQKMVFLQCMLNCRNCRFGYPLLGHSMETNIRYILGVHSSLVSIIQKQEPRAAGGGDICRVKFELGDAVRHMVFQHYANQILNSIFPFSLLAHLLHQESLGSKNGSSVPPSQLPPPGSSQQYSSTATTPLDISSRGQNYVFLRELFQEDFLYEPGTETEELERSLEIFKTWKFSGQQSLGAASLFCGHDSGPPDENSFTLLRNALEPYFLAYWGVLRRLLQLKPQAHFELKAFGKTCQDYLALRITSGQLPPTYAALSLDTISNAVTSLLKPSVGSGLERIKMDDGSFGIVIQNSSLLSSISRRFDRLVEGGDWKMSEEDTGKHSSCSFNSSFPDEDYLAPSSDQLQLRSKL